MQDVWPWLFDDEEDRRLFKALQSQLMYITKQQEGASAAMYHLEAELVAAACHDPGSLIERKLVLPLIQQRINEAADAAAQQQAENQDVNKVSVYRMCVATLAVNPCHLNASDRDLMRLQKPSPP